MSITDIISFSLGILSLLLGVYSVIQSKKYKYLADKLENDREQILREIRNKSDLSVVTLRSIEDKLDSIPKKIKLNKDEIKIWKNSKYKSSNLSIIINKLKNELPNVVKPRFIDLIIESLNKCNEKQTEIAIVTLRYQYDKEDLHIIKKLNDSFNEYGISFELIIS